MATCAWHSAVEVIMTSHPLRNIIISILLITASSLARAEERLVFSGTPTIKVESAPQAANRVELTTQEQTEYRVLITARDGKYYWTSRENKELFHFRSGAFDWFVAPGSGYIKVVDRRYLLQEDGPRYLYMEHMTLLLNTITYWGGGEHFQP
jgi:hypothetical protein